MDSSAIRKPAPRQTDTRNWKLIHDPFLRKGLQKLYRYDGVAAGNSAYDVISVSDPRLLASRFLSRNELIDLPVPTFVIDENYVGKPALRELTFFDLNDNVSETFLSEMCKKCGATEEIKVFYHPTTKRHLGVARVMFRIEREARICMEKYNGTSIMGSIVKVVADPWGKLAKDAVDQLVAKKQASLADPLKPKEGSSSTVASSSSAKQKDEADNGLSHGQSHPLTANSSPSPAVHIAPATPVPVPHPDDPSSQSLPVASYGAFPPFPRPPYPIPPWPPTAPPPPAWPLTVPPWVPPPWPVPVPPNYAPAMPGQASSDVAPAAASNVAEKEYSARRSPSARSSSKAQPTGKEAECRSTRPSSRLDRRSRNGSEERSKEKYERTRRRSSSPEVKRRSSDRFRSRDRGSEHRATDRYSHRKRASSPASPGADRKRRCDGARRQRSTDARVQSRSPKRRKDRHRGKPGNDSDGDAKGKRRKRRGEAILESVDEEEEYYRRSKTQQHRRPASGASNSKASNEADGPVRQNGVESRKSAESEYCDEIEEYEYYRRKRRQRRHLPRSTGAKGQEGSSNSSRHLQDKFEAITSSEDDADKTEKQSRAEGGHRSSHKRRKHASPGDRTNSDISPPFGKLERISGSSDEDSQRNKARKGGRRAGSSSSSGESLSGTSSDARDRRRRYHRHYHRRRKEDSPARQKRTSQYQSRKQQPQCSKGDARPTASCSTQGSLETRIQQLLGAEPPARTAIADDGSTPLMDEHNASCQSLPSKPENTSDVEMSLSSGDEQQCAEGQSNIPKEQPTAPLGYAGPSYMSYYCNPMYLYPPPAVPPPVGFPMWPQYGGASNALPLDSSPVSSSVDRSQREGAVSAVSNVQERERITQRAVSEVRTALETVLRKDVVKRAVEASVFQAIDAWFVEKETERKAQSKDSRNETCTVSSQQMPVALTLSSLFDCRPSTSNLSLTGVPGLGLRASLPKLPSFKRKVIRQATPPSTPRRRDRSKTSTSRSSSRSSSSVSDEDKTRVTASAGQRGRAAHRRLRSDSSSSSRASSRSPSASTSDTEKVPTRAVVSSDEGETASCRAQPDNEKRLEPVSDEEIEDDVDEEQSSSSDDERVKTEASPGDEEDSEKIQPPEETENGTTDAEALPRKTPEPEDEIPSSPVAQRDDASRRNKRRVMRKKGRGRARLATTTEDECSGQENADATASARALQDDPLWSPQVVIQPLALVTAREDGVMFVQEGTSYNPAHFDHFYTSRIGETPPATLSNHKPFTVLKTKQEVTVQRDKENSERKAIAARKPSRPPVTFKSRTDVEELRICYEFLNNGIDEEDIGYLKMVYDTVTAESNSRYLRWVSHVATAELSATKRRLSPEEIPAHSTGCARTQGFYRLSHKEKRVKSRPRQALDYTEAQNQLNVNLAKQQGQFGREARSMQRRLLATLGSEVDSDLLKYNQLKFRKKQIKFSRSHIHGWGLFAMEDIAQDEMIVEYVGEKIRITVAEKREKKYEKMGVGSSYLFRIDNEMVVDATKRGNIARFINHSCNPNCYARIITVESEKRIVIYSKQNISRGEEVTYDYKFPLEDEKIPCNCGAPCCRGSLN